jgi:hypothetical protein
LTTTAGRQIRHEALQRWSAPPPVASLAMLSRFESGDRGFQHQYQYQYQYLVGRRDAGERRLI